MTLEPNYSLREVSLALGMSTRWVRDRIKHDKAEHLRQGRQIFFTAEQVEKLRASLTVKPAEVGMTTGRKKRAS